MSKKIHIIPHTHWDREWYFNTSRSTVYLLKHVKEVMDVLEEDKEYTAYILDAQSSLAEDYLDYHPEDIDRFKKLVTDKRLYIGPWYTQTDQLVVSQESIVRNLLYGQRLAKSLGHSMQIGYVPDAFGQGGNMPQIYQSFGITDVVFWRGIADTSFKDTQFKWQGDDGSIVIANNFRHGYNFGGEFGVPEKEEDMLDYLNRFQKVVAEESNTNVVYAPYGHDQAPIRENLPQLVKRMNQVDSSNQYVMGDPENFFKELNEKEEELTTWTGELTQGKHSRIHKTIFSTRADLKQLNNETENYLVNVLEPVLLISQKLGMEYPHGVVEKIWKQLFKNAAHDSIGGCNSDWTNRDVEYRYKVANDLASNLLERTMRTISNRIRSDEQILLTVFNPFPEKYTGMVEVEAYVPSLNFQLKDLRTNKTVPIVIEKSVDLTDYVLNQTIKIDSSQPIFIPEKVYKVKFKVYFTDLNGLGYNSYAIESKNTIDSNRYELIEDDLKIENDNYVVTLQDNNAISILDKQTGKTYKDQMIFVDQGDDGDSYNYSPPRQDHRIDSTQATRIKVQKYQSEINEALIIQLQVELPYDLEERAKKENSVTVPLTVRIDLEKDSQIIKFKVDVDNQILSHKFAVEFKTGIPSEYSYADQLFGPVQRKVHLPELAIWEEEEWDEMPISIEPMQSYCALSQDKETFSVITGGVREYEVVGDADDTLKLTLFRTFSHMGKEDLLYRPGRASGESIVETPDAQLLGKISCEFAVHINGSQNIEAMNLSRLSKDYLTHIPSYERADFLNGRMIFSQKREEKLYEISDSFMEVDVEDLGVSCLKGDINNKGQSVLRVFNPYLKRTVDLPDELLEWTPVKLDETNQEEYVKELNKNKFITLIK
ncbi:glycoside hydrolase family 38 C-terminal domain-containing protein [Aerococcus sp. UMB1112A]|uniref:glycoside hydrolase family 38 N-terminal domain-containing protein n=1 Tax=Aerococcus sp. UMB1112A TaxID=3050609 RepID=UPI00254CBC86|nr:glycoside hydrolase family 38 C-terminal domain-containing protein [Aerococcus sp. UMB1112A]MDK8501556.1 glycoside hydrolase family 38 C-terminal domain-containing protein [Aerococcus sp. UMB1112A]